MQKRLSISLLSLLLSLSLLVGIVPTAPVSAAADTAETVWDMESLPEGSLFDCDYVFDATSSEGGHSFGYTEATAAAGKGYSGSSAMALTLTEDCPVGSLWADGFILRINKDDTANRDWLGMEEFWFWLDASEFENSALLLDLALDGLHPQVGKTFWLVQDGVTTELSTVVAYSGVEYGRLPLPAGFQGWVGIGADAFKAIYGRVQAVTLTFAPTEDADRFPLSLYVDEFRIVRGDTAENAILGEGELFNQGVDAGTALLYTNMTLPQQTMKAFGASGCWWSNAYGLSPFVDNLLQLLFTDEGVGLNNYRHNIGGGVKADQSDTYFPNTPRAVYSPLTEDGTYDEDRDIGGYTVLMKLVEMGTIDDFTFFMNTPPATMTNSGATSGDPWADSYSNLREDCYDAYAEYVVDMVQLYNYLGVPVKYVSPINEPQYNWSEGAQEGCHYSAEEAMKVWKLVVEKLLARAQVDQTLSDVKVSLSESGMWSDKSYVNYVYYQIMNDETLSSALDHIGAHSYGTDAAAKQRLADDLWAVGADISLHQTEYGPAYPEPDYSIFTGIDVARVMHEDFSILNVDSWSYWLAAANGNFTDGLVYFNQNSADLISTKRLWAMGNYARFTKGAIRVETDNYALPESILPTAYYDPENGALVYVLVNNSYDDQTFGFAGLPAGATAEVYETSCYRDLELRGTMSADAGYQLPAMSVTTFVFRGIAPEEVASGSHPDNPTGHAANASFDYSIFASQSTADPMPTEPSEPMTSTDASETPEAQSSLLPYVVGGALLVLLLSVAVLLILRLKKKK